jgi:hypothetical protein
MCRWHLLAGNLHFHHNDCVGFGWCSAEWRKAKGQTMLRAMILFGVLFGVPAFAPAWAQTADETRWYYALEEETGELIAFTAAGEMRLLPLPEEGNDAYAQTQPFRLDDSRVLIQTETDDETLLMLVLTPDGVRSLQVPDARDYSYVPVAASASHLVLRPAAPSIEPTSALLVDLDAGAVQTLAVVHDVYLRPRFAFNGEGTALRYAAYTIDEAAGTSTLELRQHDLATGDVQIVHSRSVTRESHVAVQTTQTGDVWLVSQRNQDDDVPRLTHDVITLDSRVETIEPTASLSQMETMVYRLFDGYYVVIPPDCTGNCPILLIDRATSEERAYPLGDLVLDGGVFPVYLADDSLILSNARTYARLRPDEPATALGYFLPQMMLSSVVTSFDQRFAALLNDADNPDAVLLWDFEQDAPLARIPVEDRQLFSVLDDGTYFILNRISQRISLVALNRVTGALTEWEPLDADMHFMRLLSDSAALVLYPPDAAATEPGVYVFDRTTQSLTLLVRGAVRLLDGPLAADYARRQQ